MSLRVAGFVALSVRENEIQNPDIFLIYLAYSGRLVSDFAEQR